MQLHITVDAKPVLDGLAAVRRQMPFAMATALNGVANDAQRAIQDSLSQKFTLRRADWVKRTIKRERGTDFATKTNLVAIVRVDPQRDVLAKFEDGGVKRPTAGRAIAIPTEHVRRTKTQLIQKAQRPKALIAAGRAFSRAGKLLAKTGRGAKATLRVAYLFKASVRIPDRLGFGATAHTAVERHWETRALAAIDRALATLR